MREVIVAIKPIIETVFLGLGVLSGGLLLLCLWLDIVPKKGVYVWIVATILGLFGMFLGSL